MFCTLAPVLCVYQPTDEVVKSCARFVIPPNGRVLLRNGSVTNFPVSLQELESIMYLKTPKTGSTTLAGVLRRLEMLHPFIKCYTPPIGAVFGHKDEIAEWCRWLHDKTASPVPWHERVTTIGKKYRASNEGVNVQRKREELAAVLPELDEGQLPHGQYSKHSLLPTFLVFACRLTDVMGNARNPCLHPCCYSLRIQQPWTISNFS